MSDAIENAYLVLLGQIALIAAAVSFGVPYFASQPQSIRPNPPTTFFLVFVFVASALMIVNIMIGWAALRAATKTPEYYSNKMFVVDLAIIVVLFAMNNVIMFAFGDTLSLQSTSTIKAVITKGMPIKTIAFMGAALYGLTAIFLLLCKLWNKLFYAQAGTRDYSLYERFLWAIIIILGAVSVAAAFFAHSLRVQILLFIVWAVSWIYINAHWLVKDFLSTTRLDERKAA